MESGSQMEEAIQPFSCNGKDTRGAEGDLTYNNHSEKEVQAEIQAMDDSSLNSVLLGLSGSVDPQPRYVGLTLGDIPLTNGTGELSADPELTSHQFQCSQLDHSPSNVSFPQRVPPGLDDESNQLLMRELQIFHQPEQQQLLRMFQQSAEQQFQQQQLQIFHQAVDQQHHQQSFHQSAEQQQQQLLFPLESGEKVQNHDQNPERQKGRSFSYLNTGGDHEGAQPSFLTAWEESVKYLDNLRQLQEQHVQQQHVQQPIPPQKTDQFCLSNMPPGGSGAQSIPNFPMGEFDPVHQENAFTRDKLAMNNMQSDFYNAPQLQPSRLSISTSASDAVLGFAGSPVSVQSPGPTNRRPSGPVNSCHSPGANPYTFQIMDRNSSSPQVFGMNDIQPPTIPYIGLNNKLISYNSVPAAGSNQGPFSKFLNNSCNTAAAPAAGSSGLFSADIPIKPVYSCVDQEFQLGYAHAHRNEPAGPRDHPVFSNAPRPTVTHGQQQFLQEIPRRSKSAAGRLLGDLEPKPLHHFATERQRREHLNEKYQTLRSLVPNPTKADRASIVSDAISRIHELKKEEESLLADRNDRQSRKQLPHEVRGNSCKRPRLAMVDGAGMDQRDEEDDEPLRAQWIRKVSKHGTEVEVRIVCDEVEVNIKQIHSPRFLVRFMTAIELGLKLRVLDGNGGVIKNCNIYRFRLKMKADSCTFIGLIVTKLLEVLDAAL